MKTNSSSNSSTSKKTVAAHMVVLARAALGYVVSLGDPALTESRLLATCRNAGQLVEWCQDHVGTDYSVNHVINLTRIPQVRALVPDTFTADYVAMMASPAKALPSMAEAESMAMDMAACMDDLAAQEGWDAATAAEAAATGADAVAQALTTPSDLTPEQVLAAARKLYAGEATARRRCVAKGLGLRLVGGALRTATELLHERTSADLTQASQDVRINPSSTVVTGATLWLLCAELAD